MSQVFFIAEAGVNHNGDRDLALRLIDIAVDAKADAVKFQTFHADSLVTAAAPKADYQSRTTDPAESQFKMLEKLELSKEEHQDLFDYCQDRDIEFMSTPFDLPGLVFLTHDLGVNRLKLSSGSVTHGPLLLAAARSKKPIILSTGMATLEEVSDALDLLAYGYTQSTTPDSTSQFHCYRHQPECANILSKNVTLLHCTSDYPASYADVNLRAMATLSEKFGLRVGYSDHTVGNAVSSAAAALGATVIEKHFTIDRRHPGPDHAASLEPEELKALVVAIRQTEQALGSPEKMPTDTELRTAEVARTSVVAACDIAAGTQFSTETLAVKRPGTGVSPMKYWDLEGAFSDRDYQTDEMIKN